jgi:protein-tyrosine phosphatase
LALDSLNAGHMSRYTTSRLVDLQMPVDEYQRDPKDLELVDLNSAHHVVAVKASEHRPLITRRFPEWLDKIEFWEVHDIDCARPEEALPHLEKEVLGLMQRLR